MSKSIYLQTYGWTYVSKRGIPETLLAGIVLTAVISGCQWGGGISSVGAPTGPSSTTDFVIVSSDPPGAKIYVNEKYVGEAKSRDAYSRGEVPFRIILNRRYTTQTMSVMGTHRVFLDSFRIEARPTGPGKYPQVKTIGRAEPTPDSIHFEMKRKPPNWKNLIAPRQNE